MAVSQAENFPYASDAAPKRGEEYWEGKGRIHLSMVSPSLSIYIFMTRNAYISNNSDPSLSLYEPAITSEWVKGHKIIISIRLLTSIRLLR